MFYIVKRMKRQGPGRLEENSFKPHIGEKTKKSDNTNAVKDVEKLVGTRNGRAITEV